MGFLAGILIKQVLLDEATRRIALGVLSQIVADAPEVLFPGGYGAPLLHLKSGSDRRLLAPYRQEDWIFQEYWTGGRNGKEQPPWELAPRKTCRGGALYPPLLIQKT